MLLGFQKKEMFNFFKKTTEKEKLQKQYESLMQEYFVLSKSNRAKADEKYAEAQVVLLKLESLGK